MNLQILRGDIFNIRVKEFGAYFWSLDESINEFIASNKIKRVIDIKYSANATGTFALLIYEI